VRHLCAWLLCFVFLSVVGTPLTGHAIPTVGKPVASLSFIPVRQPTTLTVTSTITTLRSDPALIPNSVTLLQARGDGVKSTTQTVRIMHDDGLAGDTVTGDKVYTLQFTVTEATAGELRFQVSTAFQGELKRRLSGVTTVPLVSTGYVRVASQGGSYGEPAGPGEQL
jgi:hypothetical protein